MTTFALVNSMVDCVIAIPLAPVREGHEVGTPTVAGAGERFIKGAEKALRQVRRTANLESDQDAQLLRGHGRYARQIGERISEPSPALFKLILKMKPHPALNDLIDSTVTL